MELNQAQYADRLVSGMSDAIVYADAEGASYRVEAGGAGRLHRDTSVEPSSSHMTLCWRVLF